MKSPREDCVNKDRCGKSGHYLEPTQNRWVRCDCLKLELMQKSLGSFYCPNPIDHSTLEKYTNENLIVEGTIVSVRRHVARALLEMQIQGKTFRSMDAYRLIEIYLEKDKEFETTTQGVDVDLLILLLGFGDPRNRYLPELVVQAIDRREISFRPTWVVLGVPIGQVAMKYSSELADRLKSFRKVKA